ncbi:hypothetical protein SAMN04487949_0965 [Halogranum gelatinilyticum]|uniref:Uncharacterized protein n=1 Tax=Halogranum gelatinilyticum TaxID=660521 RepID=A0A1G9QPK7_9EURY|nr:hypothetical protein [Halogranum gelatinilyticum]SDM12903.1 hypothetical protein SAMN04487949_0965 [Halogranum gelatinilyticum]
MTTPPSLVLHVALAGLSLVGSVSWFIWVRYRRPGYSRRRLGVSVTGLLVTTTILLHGLLVYGYLFGYGWSNTFGDGYGPAFPLVAVEFVSVALFVATAQSLRMSKGTSVES